MRGATALVTCGAGFIGSKIVDAQFSAGGRALDDLSMGNRRNLVVVTTSPIAELIVGSVSGAASVRHTVAGCSHVFHLAAMVVIEQSVHEPTKNFNTNILGTEIVLRESAAANVSSVFFTSSSAVHGLTPTILSRESDPVVAANPYAAGKAQGEMLTESYANRWLG